MSIADAVDPGAAGDHVDGYVVVIHATSGGVDAGKLGAAVKVVFAFPGGTGALTAISWKIVRSSGTEGRVSARKKNGDKSRRELRQTPTVLSFRLRVVAGVDV